MRTKPLSTAIIRSDRVVMDVVLVHEAISFIGSVAIGANGMFGVVEILFSEQ